MTTAIEQPPEVLAALMSEQEAREVAGKIRRGIGELRRLLVEFKEREGWRALGYANLDDCCRAEFNIGRSHLYRQLAAAVVERNVGSPIGDNPESHLRPLAGRSPEVQRQAFAEASANGAPTAEKVRQAVERIEQPEQRPTPELMVPAKIQAATQAQVNALRERVTDLTRDRQPEQPSDLGEIEAAVLKRHGISVGKAAGYFAQVVAAAEQGGATWEMRLKAACRPGLK